MRLIDADKAKEKLRGNAQKDGNPFRWGNRGAEVK